ncbi:transferase [Lacinutrix sp. Hel_I_90]|uniref:acyltransferase n=1 Tax=Lacinutrix sp. Hel_I_90 TaxID=1249999 RepID=UPI001E2A0332|nr:transferase [Lacinutrix sp. Hel_I_90]
MQLPFFIYGKARFTSIAGDFIIDAPIQRGMIGFGQPYEINKASMGISEFNVNGTLIFKGYFQLGKDFFVFTSKHAVCEFGHMSSLGCRSKIVCTSSIKFGEFARLGPECQVIDTNFHNMKNTITHEVFEKSKPIDVGSYNFISNRVTLLKGSSTPKYCTIASNSVCTRDYTALGNNILIGGAPAKLIKENIARDWSGEKEGLESLLMIFKK